MAKSSERLETSLTGQASQRMDFHRNSPNQEGPLDLAVPFGQQLPLHHSQPGWDTEVTRGALGLDAHITPRSINQTLGGGAGNLYFSVKLRSKVWLCLC